MLRPLLIRKGDVGRLGMPAELKVAVGLMMLGRGESTRGLEPFGVSRSAANVVLLLFLNAVIEKLGHLIRIPSADHAPGYQKVFREMAGNRVNICPDIIGAVDGTHIKIRPPRSQTASYINRKCYPSLNVQAIADGNCRFMHVYVGAPGRVHDARVFAESKVAELLPNKCIILGEFYAVHSPAAAIAYHSLKLNFALLTQVTLLTR